jgi:hypothetical protein
VRGVESRREGGEGAWAYAEGGEGGGRDVRDALAFGLEEGEVLALLGLAEEAPVQLRALRRGALAGHLPPEQHGQRHRAASPRAAAAAGAPSARGPRARRHLPARPPPLQPPPQRRIRCAGERGGRSPCLSLAPFGAAPFLGGEEREGGGGGGGGATKRKRKRREERRGWSDRMGHMRVAGWISACPYSGFVFSLNGSRVQSTDPTIMIYAYAIRGDYRSTTDGYCLYYMFLYFLFEFGSGIDIIELCWIKLE